MDGTDRLWWWQSQRLTPPANHKILSQTQSLRVHHEANAAIEIKERYKEVARHCEWQLMESSKKLVLIFPKHMETPPLETPVTHPQLLLLRYCVYLHLDKSSLTRLRKQSGNVSSRIYSEQETQSSMNNPVSDNHARWSRRVQFFLKRPQSSTVPQNPHFLQRLIHH